MDEWKDLVEIAWILSHNEIFSGVKGHQPHCLQLIHVSIGKGIFDLVQVQNYRGFRLIRAVEDWLQSQFWKLVRWFQKK